MWALERWGSKAIVVNQDNGHHITKDPVPMAKANKSLARAIKKSEKAKKPQPVHKDKAIVQSAYDAAFMEEMAKSFVVTPEQQNKQAIESWLAAKRATPAKEAVMFNMDLLRHIGSFIPNPIKNAVPELRRAINYEITYASNIPEINNLKFTDLLRYISHRLSHANSYDDSNLHIYDTFQCGDSEEYNEPPEDAFEDLYGVLKALEIQDLFDFSHYKIKSYADTAELFSNNWDYDRVAVEFDRYNEYREEEGQAPLQPIDVEFLIPTVLIGKPYKEQQVKRYLDASDKIDALLKHKGIAIPY
jgi:hypothetical protein